MRYRHLLGMVTDSPWAILESKLAEITGMIERITAGDELSDDQLDAIIAARPQRPSPNTGAAVAVLSLWGTMLPRAGKMEQSSGVIGTDQFAASFRFAMEDPSVSAVVVSVDSPGGSVAGVEELASDVYRLRGRKPVVAVSDSLMASAAYWAMAGASEIVATPSAMVGSVGVVAIHLDKSGAMEKAGVKATVITHGRYKAEGSPFGPMSEEAIAHTQEEVSYYGGMFERAVARGRGVPIAKVRADFGEGRVFNADKAKRAGMIDRVATLDQVIGELAAGKWARPMRAAAVSMTFGTTSTVTTMGEPLIFDAADPGDEWIKPPEVVEDEPSRSASVEYRRRRLRVLAASG